MLRILSAKRVPDGVFVCFEPQESIQKIEKFFHRWWLADNCNASTRFEGNSQKHTNAPDRVVEAYVFQILNRMRILSLYLSLLFHLLDCVSPERLTSRSFSNVTV